jgi:hypothetical protein
MKKLCLVILAVVVVGTFSYGLDIEVGSQVAGGFAGFLGQDYKDYLDSFTGSRAFLLNYGAGVYATIAFMQLIAIQPEVMLWRIGGADKDPADEVYLYRSHHISPAVLLQLRIGLLRVLAGPMVMVKISTGKEGWIYSDGTKNLVDMAENDVTRLIFAATLGIGIHYPLGIGNLMAQVRGIYGFNSYWKQDVWTDMWYPFVIAVMLGYSIPITR